MDTRDRFRSLFTTDTVLEDEIDDPEFSRYIEEYEKRHAPPVIDGVWETAYGERPVFDEVDLEDGESDE